MSEQISIPTGTFETTRRDFLYVASVAVGAIGAAATLIPLIEQMNPDASTLAAGGPVDFDLSSMQPGQQVVVRWRQRPVFVVNRTPQMLKSLQDPNLVAGLADAQSTQRQQPPYAENWHRSQNLNTACWSGYALISDASHYSSPLRTLSSRP